MKFKEPDEKVLKSAVGRLRGSPFKVKKTISAIMPFFKPLTIPL